MTEQTIPVVNLEDFKFGSKAKQEAFVNTLGDALNDLGFFALEGHGIADHLIANSYKCAEDFFKLNEQSKRQYEVAGLKGQRGYTSFGREHAKDSKAPDLKEFWHVGRESFTVPARSELYPQNVWPKEIEAFRKNMLSLYGSLERCALDLLKACALYLGEDQNLFSDMAVDGNSILRVIHYPPISNDMDPSSVRAAAHEDINLITLLCESTASGLELLQRDGKWRPISSVKGQIIVDTGDMIQNVTNGILKSTTHRVVNPDNSRERRFSMPFFVHPRSEVDLTPRASCINRCDGVKKYPNITAGEYLHQRLREIGLA